MYASVLVLGSLLAGQALAAHEMLLPFSGAGLSKRQSGDQSFIPDTTPGCPAGWPICGTSDICYSPSRGDTCCPGGTYACPGGTFCLQDGYCCPDGLDRESCAKKFGVTLKPTTTAEPTTSSSSSSTSTTSTTSSTSSKPVIPTSSSSSSTTTPAPTSSSAVPPAGTSTGAATSSPPLFTGGANAQAVGGAAAVLGGLGMIGNLLI